MSGYTTIRGTVVADTDLQGKPLDQGPLYLQPEDGTRRLLLIGASMAAQASVEYLASQSRASFLPALGKMVQISGYRTSGTIYDAQLVDAPNLDFDPPASR